MFAAFLALFQVKTPIQKKQPQAGFEPTTFRLLSECSTPKLLWLSRKKETTGGVEPPTFRLQSECSATKLSRLQKKSDTFSICACHPCAGAMLIFSVSFQFYRMRRLLHRSGKILFPEAGCLSLKKVEEQGIDPCAFCMQSRRSTI